MAVNIKTQANFAVVTMDNPPVNAIGKSTREGLRDAVINLNKDSNVEFVILTGAGNIFAAGADAREFDLPLAEPHLPDVLLAIENSSTPWIAAIKGAALGGGLEIALACRFRVANPKASLGLPEVTLGLVPGSGGTQRLPRLIGIEKAIEMISMGAPVNGTKAHEIGLVDAICDDVISFAKAITVDELASATPVSDLQNPAHNQHAIDEAMKTVAKRARQQDAPPIAIALVADTASLSLEEGLKKERNAFLELRQSSQAKAMRYAFFAQRSAKPPSNISNVEPMNITQAVVVGGGNMGASIAYAMDGIGIAMTIVETNEESAERASQNISRLVDGAVKRGKLKPEDAEMQKSRIKVQTGYANLSTAQLAIEAAFEDMSVKKTVFQELENALPDNAILASNTSYLDLDEIANAVANPSSVIGLHFFSPAHIMKLLEIVKGAQTSDVALSTGYALAKRLRKIPVLSGVCDGFIGNRLLSKYREVADMVMMDGALPWEIDAAMKSFGYAMGPYETQDLSGLDIAFANRKRNEATRDPNRRYIAIADRLVEEGRLGQKTRSGWYDYTSAGGKQPDSMVEKIILEQARQANVNRRAFSEKEIQTRLIASMINEASAILQEGIAQSAIDIDLVLLHGYGFPRWRGGPLHYADETGLANILNSIREFEKEDPIVWKPNALLVKLVENNSSFADYESS